MYNTENKLMICPLQNAKLNFPKFCKVYAQQNQKANLIYLYIHLVETFALKTLHTLHEIKPLIPGGNKRLHILKQAYSF